MQTMGQNGYTDQEVHDELCFKRGANAFTFRYELFDLSNTFVRDMDEVISCSIEHNYLDDIKRTAKFLIQDMNGPWGVEYKRANPKFKIAGGDPSVPRSSAINYLSDRIKPWARLKMPTDNRTFSSIMSVIQTTTPAWYKFDETSGTVANNSGLFPTSSWNLLSQQETIDPQWLADPGISQANMTLNAIRNDVPSPWGLPVIEVHATANGTGGINTPNTFPVTAGNQYTAFAAMRGIAGRSWFVRISFYNSSHSLLGTSTATISTMNSITGAFKMLSSTGVAPAGAAFMSVVTQTTGSNTAGDVLQWTALGFGNGDLTGTAYQAPGIYPGTIGASVTKGIAGMAEGSSFYFNGISTTAGSVVITNGSRLLYYTGQPPVRTAMGFSIFVNPFQIVSNPIFQTSTNTASLKFDGSGNVVWSCVLSDGTTMTASTPNPYGLNLDHIAFSWHIGGQPQIYLNGQPGVMTITGKISLEASGITGDLWLGYGYTGGMDSVVIRNTPIGGPLASDIYRSALLLGPFGSLNYAEWPQGVFLLSSPNRNSDAALNITRNVEAYDQLEVYTDDLLEQRLVCQGASLYTNNILGLVMNYIPSNLKLNNAFAWATIVGVSGVTATGATIAGPTVAGGTDLLATVSQYSCANQDFKVNISSLPALGGGQRAIVIRSYQDPANYSQIQINILATSTIVSTQVQGGATVGTNTTTYNSTTHKYFRITEYNGYTQFQVSQTGSTWTTLLTSASLPYNNNVSFQVQPILKSGTDSAWSLLFGNSTLKAALNIPVNMTPSTEFLPASKEYPPGTSKLTVINDLLKAIAYDPLWFDENGYAVMQPYVSPAVGAPEFTYDDGQLGVTLPDSKVQTFDLFKVPNKWVGTAKNPDTGTSFSNVNNPKINSNPNSPTSTVSRGRTITKVMTDMDAPNLAKLLAQIDKIAEQDSQVYEEFDFTSALIPIHTNRNILALSYDDMGIGDKYEELGWSMDLKAGATMKHTVRRQVQIA